MSAICDDITGSVHAITGYEHATTGYVHAITGNVTAITGYDSAILGSDHTHLFRQVDRLRFLFESFPTGLSRKARELATIVALQQHRWADEGEDFDARSRNCHWPLALRTRERGEGYPPSAPHQLPVLCMPLPVLCVPLPVMCRPQPVMCMP